MADSDHNYPLLIPHDQHPPQTEGGSSCVLKLPIYNPDLSYLPDFLSEAVKNYIDKVEKKTYIILKDNDGYLHFERASYRGNSVHSSRVWRRFSQLKQIMKDSGLPMTFPRGKTRCIFMSLEYNANTYSLDDSWVTSSPDFNRYLSKLTREYGKILVLVRGYESHKSGYLHLHVLLYFLEHEFSYYRHINAKGKISYRINEAKNKAFSSWTNGFNDITASTSVYSGLRYISKYMTKTVDYQNILTMDSDSKLKGVLTLALNSRYHKRSFSISPKLKSLAYDENTLLHISTKTSSKWQFYGIAKLQANDSKGIFPDYFKIPIGDIDKFNSEFEILPAKSGSSSQPNNLIDFEYSVDKSKKDKKLLEKLKSEIKSSQGDNHNNL